MVDLDGWITRGDGLAFGEETEIEQMESWGTESHVFSLLSSNIFIIPSLIPQASIGK